MQQGNQNPAELNFDEFSSATYDQWKEAAVAALKGAPFDKVMFTKLVDGLTLKPIYNKEDLPATIEEPGVFPYRRSTTTLGYACRPWDVAQTVYARCPKGFNEKAKTELAKGSTALTVNLSCKVGTKLKSLDSWKIAFEGISMTAQPLYIYPGSCGLPQLVFLQEACKAQGGNIADLKGAMMFDPISSLLTKGSLCGKMGFCGAMKEMATMTKWAIAQNKSGFTTIGVNGATYSNAGASAQDEVAFMLATATTYLREMMAAGLSVDEVAPRIRFNAGIGSNLFLELCKLRALRMLWAQVVRACGGSDESAKIKLSATTSRWTVSKVDPWVNMLRATSQAFSAVLGTVDSLDVAPFDVAVRQPDEFSCHIARNVQLMLAGEFSLDKVVDPAGGAYYVEAFTEALAQSAYAQFQALEAQGGMVEAIKAGTVQQWVGTTCAARLKMVDQRRQTVVGCNKYVNLDEEALEQPEVSEHAAACKAKAEGHSCSCGEAEVLKITCDCPNELAAFAATEKSCRIQKGLVALYGCDCGLTEVTPLEAHHLSERFEALLEKSAAIKASTGTRPTVALATAGALRQHKARADFAQDFLRSAGFDAFYPQGSNSPEEMAKVAAESGCKACVICSTDDTYPEIVPAFCTAVRALCPDMYILLAGYPVEHVDAFKAAGVDEFIHVKANCFEVLDSLQKKLGI